MFALPTPTKTKLLDYKTLSKKNRPPEEKPGVKLMVEQQLPNTVLDLFDPQLRADFYMAAAGAKTAAQGSLEGVEPVSDTPVLTNVGQKIGKIPWQHEMTGYSVGLVRGIGAGKNSNIPLDDAVLSNWRITFKEGGTIVARYNIEAGNVPGSAWETFAELKSREFEITAKPPEITQRDIERDAIPPAPARRPGAAERAAAAKAGKDTGPKAPHKEAKAPAAELSPEAAWPFPKGDKGTDKPPQRTTVENVKPARTARGAAKTKAALSAGVQ